MEEIKNWLQSGSINVFGKPFAGKDTVCLELAKLLNGVQIGGGDILRTNQAHAATQAKVEDGSLAPTKEFLEIVLPYFSQDSLKNLPLILSSIGRWHGEEDCVFNAAHDSGHPLKAVIYLEVSEAEIQKRWKISQQLKDRGQRKDDAEHVLEKRLDEFNNKTVPVLDYYKNKGLLITVNGANSREDVLREIFDKLLAFIKNNQ